MHAFRSKALAKLFFSQDHFFFRIFILPSTYTTMLGGVLSSRRRVQSASAPAVALTFANALALHFNDGSLMESSHHNLDAGK